MSDKHVAMTMIDDEETLFLEEKSRSKMSEKAKDLEIIDKNISHKLIDYEKLNIHSECFRKCFTPQQEMDAEQAFWLHISNPTSKPFDASPITIEAPKELPKASLVNESLKKLKFHLPNLTMFLRLKDEALEAIIKCIKNIQVQLNSTVRNVRTNNGTEFVNLTLRKFYENVGISHQTSVARTPQQNGVVKRQNQTLVEAARTMLIFSKAPLFLWAEAINTACYIKTRSIIHRRYNKTPYELMQDKKPEVSFFHIFGALCYPTNNNDDLSKLDAKADIGLVPNTVSQQPCIPPNRYDWDHLFQPMFDEYFNTPTIAVSLVPVAAAPRAADLSDSPVSTSIDWDAPSSSTPSAQEQ
nr:retrovirus-related Pol polyprotein from transposon TNT 1-94 [Tanacetum cinerariifolium]